MEYYEIENMCSEAPKFNVKCIGTERILIIGIRMVETKATST